MDVLCKDRQNFGDVQIILLFLEGKKLNLPKKTDKIF
jgi:hypothetical protein